MIKKPASFKSEGGGFLYYYLLCVRDRNALSRKTERENKWRRDENELLIIID